MDVIKYRKIFLNRRRFPMTIDRQWIEERKHLNYWDYHNQGQHEDVLSGKGFWINNKTLCMGYEMNIQIYSRTIFTPIFCHERQRLLDNVNLNIINPDNFWKKVKSKYYNNLVTAMPKAIPIECILLIIPYIY